MLVELNIKNYALIDNINIEFKPGFNVLTGETGAGKSIIISALLLTLGSRGNKEMIRRDCDRLVVQALFSFEKLSRELKDYLEAAGIDPEDDLILSREIHVTGRNICRINGLIVNVNDLKFVGERVVDIHSQREHNYLLNRDNHKNILDLYGRGELKELTEGIHSLYAEYRNVVDEKNSILRNEAVLEREMDMFKFQLKEITAIDFDMGEDDELEGRLRILSNAEVLFKNSNMAYDILYSKERSVFDELNFCISQLEETARIDESVRQLTEGLREVSVNVEDLAYSLRDYKESVIFDDAELDLIQDKLNKLNTLKRKYGPELSDVKKYKEEIQGKLDMIESKERILQDLDVKIKRQTKEYRECAKKMTLARIKTAEKFSKQINSALTDLEMKNARFSVDVKSDDEEKNFSPDGVDTIEFLMIANKGEDFKPLIKIASGGEISRIMLGVKGVLSDAYEIGTLIFDEIDTGISGEAASAVGEKMRALSKNHQLIAITHLPQIASLADVHYEVTKNTGEYETKTDFRLLDFEDRVKAMAKMYDGKKMTAKSLEHAREILVRNSSI
ncbi:MAG: DNA repair protein RecN [Eubacteriaceae bacterium]|nr:DNA repair protein RecN [Eubacteriaceae bacterium]